MWYFQSFNWKTTFFIPFWCLGFEILYRCQHLILFIESFAFLHFGTCFVWEVWDLVTKSNFPWHIEVTEKLYHLFVKMSSHFLVLPSPHFSLLWLLDPLADVGQWQYSFENGVQATDIIKSGPPRWTTHSLASRSSFPIILFIAFALHLLSVCFIYL